MKVIFIKAKKPFSIDIAQFSTGFRPIFFIKNYLNVI